MGNVCCGRKKPKQKITLLLVGLDNAGKTVAAKGLAGEKIDGVVPTVGFAIINLKYRKYHIKLYDLGGGPNIRGIWHKYFVDAHGVIFVLDASDAHRLNEAKEVLVNVISHEKIAGKPLLFLANKQDNENALDEIDIIEKINLEEIVNLYQCPTLLETCAATDLNSKIKVDPGIQKGYSWLLSYVDRNFEGLNTRVLKDVKDQEDIERNLRKEITERLKTIKANENKDDLIELYSEYTKKLNDNNPSNENLTQETSNISPKTPKIVENDQINSASSSSTESFPTVYHNNVRINKKAWDDERPKSAKDLVRDQLQLSLRQKTSPRVNQTQPVNLIGGITRTPQSAKERKFTQTQILQRRILKSAGDIYPNNSQGELPNMVLPNGPNGDALNNDLFQINNFKKRSLPPLKINGNVKFSKNINHVPLDFDENSIAVISVD